MKTTSPHEFMLIISCLLVFLVATNRIDFRFEPQMDANERK